MKKFQQHECLHPKARSRTRPPVHSFSRIFRGDRPLFFHIFPGRAPPKNMEKIHLSAEGPRSRRRGIFSRGVAPPLILEGGDFCQSLRVAPRRKIQSARFLRVFFYSRAFPSVFPLSLHLCLCPCIVLFHRFNVFYLNLVFIVSL